MDEARLIEKLQAIEALFAGATTPGERTAAGLARRRIMDRLKEMASADPPVEHKFKLGDIWSRRVLLALLRRYDLEPYRYRGQRHTTVMVRVSRRFVQETLWPEFEQLTASLNAYLQEVTERVVASVLHGDASEAAEVEEPRALGAAR
jgi:hypothetical protein